MCRACGDLGVGCVNNGRLLEEIKGGAEHRPSSEMVLDQNGSHGPTTSEETDAELGADSGG